MTRKEFKRFLGMRLIDLLVVSPTPSEEGLALIFQDIDGTNHRAPPIPRKRWSVLIAAIETMTTWTR